MPGLRMLCLGVCCLTAQDDAALVWRAQGGRHARFASPPALDLFAASQLLRVPTAGTSFLTPETNEVVADRHLDTKARVHARERARVCVR
jgi:hypothetical protein